MWPSSHVRNACSSSHALSGTHRSHCVHSCCSAPHEGQRFSSRSCDVSLSGSLQLGQLGSGGGRVSLEQVPFLAPSQVPLQLLEAACLALWVRVGCGSGLRPGLPRRRLI